LIANRKSYIFMSCLIFSDFLFLGASYKVKIKVSRKSLVELNAGFRKLRCKKVVKLYLKNTDKKKVFEKGFESKES